MEDKEIRALVSLISDEDKEIVAHVEKRIIALGDEAIPFLELEWENNLQPGVQKRIEELIHALQFQALKGKLQTWNDTGGVDLLEGMWLIATYQYPDLEFAKVKSAIEQIYYETWLELEADLHPFDQIKILNSVLFGKLRFGANTKNFHAPANSMINIVLETHKGNPITLCVIYMLVAQKLKMPVFGVNLPNLFILTYKTDTSQFYINAFNKGLIFSKSDIDNYLAHLNLSKLDIFYNPCTHIDIVKRVLRNLALSFEKTGDNDKVEEIRDLLTCLTETGDNSNNFYV